MLVFIDTDERNQKFRYQVPESLRREAIDYVQIQHIPDGHCLLTFYVTQYIPDTQADATRVAVFQVYMTDDLAMATVQAFERTLKAESKLIS